jgi:uncharacterized lipoprotein YddW (UPF0748 family)
MIVAPLLVAAFGVTSATHNVPVLRTPAMIADPVVSVAMTSAPPPVTREFRGVWVATVGNMDWPSRPGLSTARQQAELIAILDRAVVLGLNAVIFQVRPAGDALYESKLEPWSAVLSGRQGVAPSPYYDPLEFAIAEAHKRGLELHAWFNPYRAGRIGTGVAPARTHIRVQRPDLVVRYGSYLWMDPGEAAVLAHTRAVILDVVKRYDVDAIHIDDYFYPYRETDARGRTLPFPDDASWRKYRASGGKLSRDDWRRHNVDRLVAELYKGIRETKPWVKFGVSPFGIWRPGHPQGVFGLDSYVEIYADSRKWLRNGWVDYLAPQLYWRVTAPRQPYERLLDWWVGENAHGRHVWPGLFTSKSAEYDNGGFTWRAAEILEQVRLTRERSGATGNIHFSMRAMESNRDSIVQRLANTYSEPALVPSSPWLDPSPPAPPQAIATPDLTTGSVFVRFTPGDGKRVSHWVVRELRAGHWTTRVLPGAERSYTAWDADASGVEELIITAVDRVGNESVGARLALTREVASARR